MADGVIDRAAGDPHGAIDGADLIVIAAPPLETIDLIRQLGADLSGSLAPGALVTDVASTKGAVMAAAAASGVRFVGGHPMAGLETSGYATSRADLFVDRPWVVVTPDGESADFGAPVRWLAAACRARPLDLAAVEHDAATAAVSHLPLVLAAALVEAVSGGNASSWPLASSLAASGWASATRLARGDARMGAGISATNALSIADALRAYRDAIDSWLLALERDPAPDAEALQGRFEAARALLIAEDEGR